MEATETISLVEKLWLFIHARTERRDAEVVAFGRRSAECCRELVKATDIGSDEARLAHERAIEMYELVVAAFRRTTPNDPPIQLNTEIVLRALSAARIYFWLSVKHDRGTDRALRQALLEYPDYRSRSMTAMDQLTKPLTRRSRYDGATVARYRDACDPDEHAAVEAVRQVCLRDIARLEAILASFPR